MIELFGGNDGLNTVVPYTNDHYYKARPTLNIPADRVLKLNDELGFHPEFKGMERLYQEGKVAVINGVSYPNAIRSHFKAMEVMRSARPKVPHSTYGWLGRFADEFQPERTQSDFLVNVEREQNLAVTGRIHSPVVFYEAAAFKRQADPVVEPVLRDLLPPVAKLSKRDKLDLVRKISAGVTDVSAKVRQAVAQYKSDVDYGAESSQGTTIFGEPAATLSHDLKKVAACLEGNLGARVYYVNYTGGWDTHRQQGSLQGPHAALLGYTGDAVRGFMQDLQRMGQAEDVTILILTEFGRRVKENGRPNNGTDHGMAGPWFVVGNHIKGGVYFDYPNLTDLDQGDLKMRVDFRSVYTTMLKDWLGYGGDFQPILEGDFPTIPLLV
ncbi:MAG: DUF1501 domain-containing protein [Planctomycetia bacterium]|nr:DUF1501 domain-containing protein [Planctomycetia bacterium]